MPEIVLLSQWRMLTLAAAFWDLTGIEAARTSLATLGKTQATIERRLLEALEAKHPHDAAKEQKLVFCKKNYNDQRQGCRRPHGSLFSRRYNVDLVVLWCS